MNTGEQLYKHGCGLYANSDFVAAESCFRDCLDKFPDNPDLYNALGSTLEAQGRLDEAESYFLRACRLQPTGAAFHYNFANLLRRRRDFSRAEEEYLAALAADTELAEALHGLGSLYLEQGRLEAAEACLGKAATCAPTLVVALYDMGNLQQRKGDDGAAESWYRRCLTLAPDFVPAMNALGMLLLRSNRIDAAQCYFEQALDLEPSYLQARCNLAVLDTWCGRLEEAVGVLRQVLQQVPDDGDMHFNLALALLTAGKMAEGWGEFEWRFRKANPVPVRHGAIPRWTGEPLVGRTILVHAEQGYGDSLQFIRYVPMLAKRGATVLIEGQDANITSLLATVAGVTAAVSRGEPLPLNPDFQVPMMSLAAELAAEGWPPPVPPYLRPPENRITFWRRRLSLLTGVKVGIAWAGRPEHQNDTNRSLPPELLAALDQLHGVSWVSLQFGPYHARSVPLPLIEPADQVADFCDSAALVLALDLVIAVDSAVAHLAGALGKPVWLLLPWNADWRWMRDRSDSPWYPSMRLYRQTMPGEWGQVLEEVAKDLQLGPGSGRTSRVSAEQAGNTTHELATGGVNNVMQRDFSRLNAFLDQLEADVYPEAPSQIHSEITRIALQRLMQLFPLKDGMRVLDVGCGQGPALDFFREQRLNYLGVTLGDVDVVACQTQGFNVTKMDQSFLTFPDESQDLVWARHVIEHSIFPLFTLHGFNRVLRHGGMLYLEVPAPETSCHHERNPNHYSVFSKACWRTLLERSSFRILGDVDYSFEVPAGPDLYWGFYCVKQS